MSTLGQATGDTFFSMYTVCQKSTPSCLSTYSSAVEGIVVLYFVKILTAMLRGYYMMCTVRLEGKGQ